jgi:archaellum component FlaC
MGKVQRGTFSQRELDDLVENIHTLAFLVKFVSKGLNLPKQKLLTQVHGKLIDLGEMVYKNEIISSIEIDLGYDE